MGKTTLEEQALAAAIELRQATVEVTELRRINQMRMRDCESFLGGDLACPLSITAQWCENCQMYPTLSARYKAASKRRGDALQRLRYIAQQAIKKVRDGA